MKKIFLLFILSIVIASCDSENANDCFQTAGNIIQQEFTVTAFDKILIHERVSLVLKEGPQQVVVETGENLLPDVAVEVVNNRLIITDNNTCNYVRDYGITKVIVTAPNITEIRNSSEGSVRSDGVLNYTNLSLLSEDFQNDFTNVGDFYLDINATTFKITSNGNSNFYIKGATTNLNVGFYAGDCRFEGAQLIADNVTLLTRSTNDILVHPVNEIKGNIYSVGDVISFTHPPIVNVTAHYTGKLLYN